MVFQGANVYSNAVKNSVLGLNSTLANDKKLQNFTGMTSVYSTESGLLNSTVPALLPQLSTLESSIVSQLSTSLGVTPKSLIDTLYSFGPLPSSMVLSNYTLSIFEQKLSKNSTSGSSASVLVTSAQNLGENYTSSAVRDLASGILGNSTQAAFAASPLFDVNGTSLGDFIQSLPANATKDQISNSVNNLIANSSYGDYPFVPTRAITRDLVSQDNQTMIVIYNFSYLPSSGAINQFKVDVQNSGLSKLGAIYVTGSSVISQDLQNAFTPALSITIGPGIAISILIVSLLFLSPIAALVPIMMGGISVSIALSAIYVFLVKIGKGNITFLTPTLTILLILGLAVDYAVLQLRRTREERFNGHSTEESVGISVRWAGQAVLTAGITVIVAYIVMAVANVPLFSDVGTAIALGVSILLAASLTLLPAIELSLGDRISGPE